jgi:hypothetical protein
MIIKTQGTGTVAQEFTHNLVFTFHIPDTKLTDESFSYPTFQTNVQIA